MSDKYCQAGKVECENYDGKYCWSRPGLASVLFSDIEVCPWPSRQKKMVELVNPESYIKGKAVGHAHAIRECEEAIRKLCLGNFARMEIIAAIRAIGEKYGKD